MLLFGGAQAWWNEGHLLVNRVAMLVLEEESPMLPMKVNGILADLSNAFPDMTPSENLLPFVECATWADEIKAKGGSFQSEWHFTDIPTLDQGGRLSDFDYTPQVHNVTQAIKEIKSWAKQEDGYQESFYYQQITKNWPNMTEEVRFSAALRLLVHYVGDVHQPLHASSRFDLEHVSGDRGGNDFPVPSKDGIKNMHAVFDSVMYEYEGNDIHLPFTEESFGVFDKKAMDLMGRWGKEDLFDTTEKDPEVWAEESYIWAYNTAFNTDDIMENEPFDEEFIKGVRELLEVRIVSAGYRLAILMQDLFMDDSEEVKFLQI